MESFDVFLETGDEVELLSTNVADVNGSWRMRRFDMLRETGVVLKSGVAHVANCRFDILNLVKFDVALEILVEDELLGALVAGNFLLAGLMASDHVYGEGGWEVVPPPTNGARIGGGFWVGGAHVGVFRLDGFKCGGTARAKVELMWEGGFANVVNF